MDRPRNLPWDALVEVTGATPEFSDGRIAAALKGIRAAASNDGIEGDELLASEIRVRAEAYRRCFPSCSLTPTALASNWRRVMTESISAAPAARILQQQNAFEQARAQA